ncbi:hypothetical protein PF008_g11412 [Phytophthora fragariae]|uniref:Tyrosine-protein kinase ephrin type A/B receptor-like domain-containing protein n=1 Tax=Phytophthora fragariae TaxID=53985 RepID=A0A6G0RQV7_9STRA|nr:hypothetical protein PF008_g11412 [Phytophthora fragariae]
MRLLVIIALWVVQVCASDGIMDMLASFIDLEGLAEQAASEGGAATKPVDTTYPLASEEMNALMQMYRDCRTLQSAAMRTWCTGSDVDSVEAERDNAASCPQGVLTHPCSGRVLHANRSASEDEIEFLWPWEGLRCDAFTDPTTVTHIYLPSEGLKCELAELDLSVMVSLEQLDLSGNQLHGAFPAWLGEMTLLRLLNLQGNRLSGDIPPSFAGNDALELVNLSGNNLTASSLGFFDAFHRLQHLDLSTNKIVLEVAKGVVASEFLRTINLSHNALYGNLPELPRFQYLVSFDLSSNFFTGELPQHLSLWGREDPHDPDENSVLTILNVSNNLFTGDLPTILNQSSLRQFDVHNNNFSGFLPQFPPSLLEHVKPADFGGNDFLCPIPPALLPSSLTCICGNGYTTKSSRVTAANSSGDSRQDPMPANEAAEFCVPCPEGSYSNASTNQKCTLCSSGSAPSLSSSRTADHCTLCLPGTFTNESGSHSCTPCPPGTISTDIGATSCDLCDPGEFTAGQGSSRCAVCPVGTFSDFMGATVCSPCPAGSYGVTEGEAECLLCSKGTYQDVVGSVECKACPVGYIAPAVGHVKCTPCSPGSFYDMESKTCVLCRPGTFTGASAQTEWSNCGNGTVAESAGSTKCIAIASPGWGYESSEAAAVAVKCGAGTFNDGTRRTCQPCPPGTFAAATGAQMCSPCEKGSFAAIEGSSKCENSPAGSFTSNKSATRAELCPPNHIAATEGLSVCTQCQPPSFSFLTGGVECIFAKPGEVYERVEWPRVLLELAVTGKREIVDESLEIVFQTWRDTLTSHTASSYQLHVLQVAQSITSTTSTHILVAVETITPTKVSADKKIPGKVENAVKDAENALDDLLDELNASIYGNESHNSEEGQILDLITSRSFQNSLVRQLDHLNLFDGALTSDMVNLTVLDPAFTSTRAVACTPGTFFTLTEDSNQTDRECRPCVPGSFSASSGSLKCEPCPRGTFSALEGQAKCESCPVGFDSAPGALSCVSCSWFTYACNGFWTDLVVAVCVVAALLRTICKKARKWSAGDPEERELDESVALMAAVRTHGRTLDQVQYEPMGEVSAETMFGHGTLNM